MKSILKVSVMVVAYNQAHLIRETLDSILTQDYANMEIVVADDASTDGTQEILREYANRYHDKVVIVLNSQHVGITKNSNAAFTACKGELICLFAGDDVMLPGKIRAQVDVFDDPFVVLSYHSVDIFDSASGKTLDITFSRSRKFVKDVADIILCGGLPGITSVMVRRSACPTTGFDTRLPSVSDSLFVIEVALQGKIAKVDGVYSRYRKHSKGASNLTFELLEESLYAFDLAIQKHPERSELVDLCRKGKARYLAGEAFRQLWQNIHLAKTLAKRSVILDPFNLRYKVMLFLCYIPIVQAVGPLLNRAKYAIRRRVV